jgi:prepilin-type N-terminal cleavage/methylation domain-containing protein
VTTKLVSAIDVRRARIPGARGFTLLELIVVLVLLAIIAAISAPQLAGMVRRAAVQKASSDFLAITRLARSTACLKQKSLELMLKPETREMYLVPYTPKVKSSGIEAVDQLFEKNKVSTKKPEESNAPFSRLEWPDRVKLTAVKLREKDGFYKVRFNPDGTSEDARLVFEDGGLRVNVEVEAVSGRARIVPATESKP